MNRKKSFLLLTAAAFCCMLAADAVLAKPRSPRQSGLESPGERRRAPPEALRGHVDAYGRPFVPGEAEEKPQKRRLPPGAYGRGAEKERPLPDVKTETPAWHF